jgi:hypothetical protein
MGGPGGDCGVGTRYRDRMSKSFPFRKTRWTRLLWPMVRGTVTAELGDGHIRVNMGWIGGADIAITNVARLSTMRWPWWGGLGVRLGRSMAAFTTAPGTVAVIELIDTIQVRAPLKWKAQRIIMSVDDVDGFLAAVAHERQVPVGA